MNVVGGYVYAVYAAVMHRCEFCRFDEILMYGTLKKNMIEHHDLR